MERSAIRDSAAVEGTPDYASLHPGYGFANSHRQKLLQGGHEEDPDIDRKADAPEDRAQRRAVAEIGQHIGDPYDQEQPRELVDQALRRLPVFGEQHREGEEREGLDAVLVSAERALRDGVLEEGRVARPRIVEAVKSDPFDRDDR